MPLVCSDCQQPVSWVLETVGSFFGSRSLLYHYGRLLLPDNRYARHNSAVVWGCDNCKIAGTIHPTDEEQTDAQQTAPTARSSD